VGQQPEKLGSISRRRQEHVGEQAFCQESVPLKRFEVDDREGLTSLHLLRPSFDLASVQASGSHEVHLELHAGEPCVHSEIRHDRVDRGGVHERREEAPVHDSLLLDERHETSLEPISRLAGVLAQMVRMSASDARVEFILGGFGVLSITAPSTLLPRVTAIESDRGGIRASKGPSDEINIAYHCAGRL